MAVPPFQEFFRPILDELVARAGPTNRADVLAAGVRRLGLTEDDLADRLPSGREPRHRNRCNWALWYFKRAGLVTSPSRSQVAIMEEGRRFAAAHPGPITVAHVRAIPAFAESMGTAIGDEQDESEGVLADAVSTPEERLQAAHKELLENVGAELRAQILAGSPELFERTVLDLLVAMGYGKGERVEHTGRTGDGGFDGIVHLDKLGLEKVYVQAKRWKDPVGPSEVQAFFGALAGRRARKGVFVTTSSFTSSAAKFAESVSDSLVLVDGAKLTRLMIDHRVGVSVAESLAIPTIDRDYFEQ